MNEGTSRILRKIKALDPNYIKMDERSMLDILLSTLKLSKNIKYYNYDNQHLGDWESFFLQDPSFIIAIILDTNINKLKNDVDQIELDITKKERTEVLFKSLLQLTKNVDNWYNLLIQSNFESTIINEIENLKNSIDDSLKEIDTKFESIRNNEKKLDIIKAKEEIALKIFNRVYGKVIYFKNNILKQFSKEVHLTHNHQPHIGLLLAFFKLFKIAQEEVNQLTERHIKYYYRDLLKQKKLHEELNLFEENTAIIACKLKEGIDELIIQNNNGFDFDFGDGYETIFYTDSSTQINQATITDIKTVYKKDYKPFDSKYTIDAFHYNMLFENDIFKMIEDKKNKLGNTQKDFPLIFGQDNNMQSDIGFIVSSPSLILEEGIQIINLEFKLVEDLFNIDSLFDKLLDKKIERELENKKTENFSKEKKEEKNRKLKTRILSKFFKQAFNLYITNKEGWKKIEYLHVSFESQRIKLHIHLKSIDDQLVSFDPLLHSGNYKTEWPCIKILLNNDATYHPYIFLKNCALESIQIKSEVSEVKNLKLSNSNGEIDNTIPFAPFGSLPLRGSFLRIQNPVILQKNLYSLDLSINWNSLPQIKGGFETFYTEYPNEIKNNSFKGHIAHSRNLTEDSDKYNIQEFELFECHEDGTLKNEKEISVKLGNLELDNKIIELNNAIVKNNSFLYLILKNPVMGFGHSLFPQIYAKAAMKSSRIFKKATPLPNQPYTPVIDQLTVRYENIVKENVLRKQDESNSTIKLFHLYPFGHLMAFPGSIKSDCFLLPQIDKKGNLFIGLQKVKANDVVSLGFDLISATFFHTVITKPQISWKYLLNNEWEDLTEFILVDQTKGLIKSGIVKIEIPGLIQFNNSRLPKGRFWIKAEFNGDEDLNSRVKNIFTQAIKVGSKTIIPTDSILKNSEENSIKIRPISNKQIEKVNGPVNLIIKDSKENDSDFYTRVSEQLRHKNRGVTNWDIERMVLQKFTQIEKVRVYGRNKYPNELVKGSNMQVVLIPKHNRIGEGKYNLDNKLDVNALQEVKRYLSKFISPYANIEVCNPVFELIKVRCRVQFKDEQQSRYLRGKLNKDLIVFLSPNIDGFNRNALFEKSFTKTEILNFIKNRPYVEKVSSFSAILIVEVIDEYKLINTDRYQYYEVEEKLRKIKKDIEFPNLRPKEVLETIAAYAIITSAPKHHIEIFDSQKRKEEKIEGIGDIAIGSDFVIINKDGNYIVDENE